MESTTPALRAARDKFEAYLLRRGVTADSYSFSTVQRPTSDLSKASLTIRIAARDTERHTVAQCVATLECGKARNVQGGLVPGYLSDI